MTENDYEFSSTEQLQKLHAELLEWIIKHPNDLGAAWRLILIKLELTKRGVKL